MSELGRRLWAGGVLGVVACPVGLILCVLAVIVCKP